MFRLREGAGVVNRPASTPQCDCGPTCENRGHCRIPEHHRENRPVSREIGHPDSQWPDHRELLAEKPYHPESFHEAQFQAAYQLSDESMQFLRNPAALSTDIAPLYELLVPAGTPHAPKPPTKYQTSLRTDATRALDTLEWIATIAAGPSLLSESTRLARIAEIANEAVEDYRPKHTRRRR